MKLKTLVMLAFSSFLVTSLLGGPPDFKQVAPAPPPCEFGTGWYFALDGGANVYQDINRSHDRTFANGDVISLSSDSNVGGWGGIKLGYVFGTGTFRPTIEEDLFYNGVPTNFHLRLNGTEVAHSSNLINSGAFMTNFIARFAFGKFQPYAGGGVGAYYAAAAGSDITINRTGTTFSTSGEGTAVPLLSRLSRAPTTTGRASGAHSLSTNFSIMSLWTWATAINRLVSNW
jgi:hypothetical protein